METGQYYLGRVVKLGQLDQAKLLDAIIKCPPLTIGKFSWAITDVLDARQEALPFVFGRLSKFSAEGSVKIVDTDNKHEISAIAKNLLVASSPFVYLPNYSGIAYLHVWNAIQEDVFPRRFKALIEAVYEGFFVECSIEPVADYRAFISKINEINRITEITAKVNPPNPLFGHIWKELKEYIKRRNASEIHVREQNKGGGALNSQIVQLVTEILDEKPPSLEPADITDAALLMAADGYGRGKVVGEKGKERIVVRTSDSKKSFIFPKDPDQFEIAKEAAMHFEKVSHERNMKHP